MRAVLLIVLLITGCNYAAPIIGGGPADPSRGPVVRRVPVDTATGITWPGNALPPQSNLAREQRICRTQKKPAGWVIRAYETMEGRCAKTPGEKYNVALIERLDFYRYGDTIAICADQRIPDGWSVAPDDPSVECPGARVIGGSPTAIVITMR